VAEAVEGVGASAGDLVGAVEDGGAVVGGAACVEAGLGLFGGADPAATVGHRFVELGQVVVPLA